MPRTVTRQAALIGLAAIAIQAAMYLLDRKILFYQSTICLWGLLLIGVAAFARNRALQLSAQMDRTQTRANIRQAVLVSGYIAILPLMASLAYSIMDVLFFDGANGYSFLFTFPAAVVVFLSPALLAILFQRAVGDEAASE